MPRNAVSKSERALCKWRHGTTVPPSVGMNSASGARKIQEVVRIFEELETSDRPRKRLRHGNDLSLEDLEWK